MRMVDFQKSKKKMKVTYHKERVGKKKGKLDGDTFQRNQRCPSPFLLAIRPDYLLCCCERVASPAHSEPAIFPPFVHL